MEREQRAIRTVRLHYVVIVAILGPLIGMLLLGGIVVLSSRGNQAATCAVVATNLREKEAKLRVYDETPPTTEAGRNVQEAEKGARDAWLKLAKALNCKEAG